jgi:hypothetical protein
MAPDLSRRFPAVLLDVWMLGLLVLLAVVSYLYALALEKLP